jgi:MFS transporter, SET family, sugar efflux transporter
MSPSAVPRLIWADADLRFLSLLMLIQGAFGCTLGPYLSVLAVRDFGLGDGGYAALLVVATVVSVAASLAAGIRADQTANRRAIALGATGLMVAGAGLMTVAPSALSLVLAHGLLLPAATLFGQIFAQTRLAAARHGPVRRDGIMAAMRAIFAFSFVIILPVWSFLIDRGTGLLQTYPVALVLAVIAWAMVARSWPRKGDVRLVDAPSGLSPGQALRELANPRLLALILCLGAVSSASTAYWAIMGLALSGADGSGTARAALYAGLVAGLEVPFMLAVPLALARIRRDRLVMLGTAIYVLEVVGIPLLAQTPWVWLCLLPGALGGAITFTLPIAILQDALSRRPGTGSALMALMKVAGDALAAATFALGTALSGYLLAAILASVLSLIGGLGLLALGRARPDQAAPLA